MGAPPHVEVARILRPERLRALFIAGSFAAFQSGDLLGTGGQDQRSGARLIQSFDAEVALCSDRSAFIVRREILKSIPRKIKKQITHPGARTTCGLLLTARWNSSARND